MSTQPKRATSETVFLFVYGSLMKGEPGHELMGNARFVAHVMKTNLCWIIDAGYPSCVETESAADCVDGEIWEVPLTDLPLLDEYEGTNYVRKQLKDSNLFAYLLKENEADKFVEIH